MEAELRENSSAEVELVASSGGVFEIAVDGRTIFSKRKTGRFPEEGEITGLIDGGQRK